MSPHESAGSSLPGEPVSEGDMADGNAEKKLPEPSDSANTASSADPGAPAASPFARSSFQGKRPASLDHSRQSTDASGAKNQTANIQKASSQVMHATSLHTRISCLAAGV